MSKFVLTTVLHLIGDQNDVQYLSIYCVYLAYIAILIANAMLYIHTVLREGDMAVSSSTGEGDRAVSSFVRCKLAVNLAISHKL